MLGKETKRKTLSIDSVFFENSAPQKEPDLLHVEFIKKHKNVSWLFSKSGKTDSFCTQDSGLYLMQDDLEKVRRGLKILKISKKFDCILPRDLRTKLEKVPGQKIDIIHEVKQRYAILREYWSDQFGGSVRTFGLSKTWNVSIVFSVIFGMFLMTMLYRYLGQDVSAKTKHSTSSKQSVERVLGDEDAKKKKMKEEEITQKLLA